MKTRSIAILSTLMLTVALAAFTGSALADNANGKGHSLDASANQSASHGNSANAPGQTKQDSTATTQATSNGSIAQNQTAQPGVKAASNTSKGTHCSTGGSGSATTCTATANSGASANVVGAGKSDASKRYGSGKTAAQIATSNGAPPATDVYGPGNSQPHKVQSCAHNGHYVDVHAVKNYSSAACSATQGSPTVTTEATCSAVKTTTTSVLPQKGHAYGLLKQGKALHTQVKTETTVTPTGNACTNGPTNTSTSTIVTSVINVLTGKNNGSATAAVTGKGTASQSGVLGVTASANHSSARAQGGVHGATASSGPQGGVLGALASAGSGQLPFTGFPLWIAVVIAAALVVLGLALVRRGRATV